MITTELHNGQGLGNQLWSYVVARVIATDKGYSFGLISPEKFKGRDFMDIDIGSQPASYDRRLVERPIIHPLSGADIRTRDERVSDVEDGTDLEGYFQDESYIAHRKDEIRQWLKVKDEYDCMDYSDDDTCVINFRGGGYAFDVDFFLPKRYWRNAMAHMLKVNPKLRFIVVTDDVKTARKFFPDIEVHHWSIGKDYAVIKNARYLIVSNSSFAWFPAWLSERLKLCVAPKYWGRHNISDGYWSLGYNLTKGWMYIDRKGELSSYERCKEELDAYMARHKDMYAYRQDNRPRKRSFMTRIRNDASIFRTLSKDVSAAYAAGWLIHARGLRGAIWIKDTLDRIATRPLKGSAFRSWKNAKRIAKKALRIRETVPEMLGERRSKNAWMSKEKIQDYRKGIKIYDAFTFFNELDLLEIRLSILDPYVDHFVLVESDTTFSGQPKPMYFKENRERFKRWEHKIMYHAVTKAPCSISELRRRLSTNIDDAERGVIECVLSWPDIESAEHYWIREGYIKESVRIPLSSLRDEDFCYISDLDEIWNPEMLIDYSKNDVFKPKQLPYQYYLNNRTDESWLDWSGTIATKYGNVRRGCINRLRTDGLTRFAVLRNGGWHFGMQGAATGTKKKILESAHPWYNADKVLPVLDDKIAKNVDYRDRNIKLWVDESDLPKYLLENRKKYKRFFK